MQVIVTAIGTTLVDRAGRKPLILVSAAGLVIGCPLAAVSFYLKAVLVLAIVNIMMCIGSFSAGMGTIPWVVMSEGVAGGFATLVNWFGAWVVSYSFNFLLSSSSYSTFILYAAINALVILFVIRVVPETKGKALEQIQAAINS
ncbi:hypothetical protein CRG98_020160 [Punica granatum]|uniref:Major facilitator superfamily (MFS) profile domain-containing protein n=1 Tax=Punica granatum TaxID=22663 RepID=A0A2I0JT09_PUNGR|nr:hypothetical protein CRG98_020160 [Punica granatum]